MESKGSRAVAAQYYVAQGIRRNPAKAIKFIRENKEYFPMATPEWIKLVMKEQKVTNEDIEKENSLIFADLKVEERAEAEKKARAEKINIMRKSDHKKRNFGHGIKSSNDGDDTPNNIYEDITLQETNEHFARLAVNLKEAEFTPVEVKGPETGGKWVPAPKSESTDESELKTTEELTSQ